MPHSAEPCTCATMFIGLTASPMSTAMVRRFTLMLPVFGSTVTSAAPATQVGLCRSSAEETAKPTPVLGGSFLEPYPHLPAATRRQFASRSAPPTVADSYGIQVFSCGHGSEIHS